MRDCLTNRRHMVEQDIEDAQNRALPAKPSTGDL